MSAYSDKVILDGALSYWRLGETAGTTAVDQKGILNATYTGGPTLGQPGAISGSGDTDTSVRFGAGGYAVVPIDPRPSGLRVWTVEAWVSPTAAVAAGSDAGIAVSYYFGYPIPFVLCYGSVEGAYASNQRLWTGFFGAPWNKCVAPADLPLNTWSHVVGTYDGTTLRLYRNGVQIASVAASGQQANADSYFLIGANWGNNYYFPGLIDEVALYPTALTATQILAHYNLGSAPPPPPQTVQVGGVYPSGYQASIVGRVISGDGHVVGGKSLGTQFGTPTVTVKIVTLVPVAGKTSAAAFGTVTAKAGTVTRAVTGLGSAQSFGTVTPKTTIVRTVTGLGSAQAFGSLAFRVTLGSGGVLTAQAFGIPTIKTAVTRTVVGLGSAQVFGTIHVAIVQMVPVGGIGSAQSFGTIKVVWSQIVQVPGLPQQGGVRSIVGGVISGDGHLVGGTGLQFGFVKIIPGRATVKLDTLGLPSAQKFGAVWIAYWQPLPILGIPSAQQFGQPVVYLVWVYDLPCTDLDLAAITCTDLDLVTVTCDTLTLVTAAATTLDLTASEAEDLDLQPAGCS